MTRAARIAATLRLVRFAFEHGNRIAVPTLFATVVDGSRTPREAANEIARLIGRSDIDKQLAEDLATLVLAP